jgi:hypothetical protein
MKRKQHSVEHNVAALAQPELVMIGDAEKGLRDALAGRTRSLEEIQESMLRRAGSIRHQRELGYTPESG